MIRESFDNYQKVYKMLEDTVSRDTYMGLLDFLISGDYKYLERLLKQHYPNMPPLCGRTIPELLAELPQDRKIVLYGAGGKGSQILPYFTGDNRFIGFCSNNEMKQKNGLLGYPVMSPEALLARRDLSVLVSAPKAKCEIMQLLQEGGYPSDQIFDMDTIAGADDPEQYFSSDIVSFEDEEVFLDVGCYNLETSLGMKRHCKRLKKVYAFEPDQENYRNCVAKKERNHFSEVEIFQFGTWSERKSLSFSATGTAGSCVNECGEGSASIPVVPIDEVVRDEDRVTFIKMDVEGAELESMRGARRIIQRDRPKLAICIYHKTEDMVTIPLYIKELVPEYKLYVRLHANDGSEAVLYAVR